MITYLRHLRIDLALHTLVQGEGRPLLLLHGLGEATPSHAPAWLTEAWPGPIAGLDFTGHGHSTVPMGGGYTCEQLMGDADAAVEHLGEVTVLGRGLGAYVALLIAGARPDRVRGAVLADGPGLSGGGGGPTSPSLSWRPRGPIRAPDPYAFMELSRDVRPPDYAAQFVRQAAANTSVEFPLHVAAGLRPSWLSAVVGEHDVVTGSVVAGLARYR